MSSSIRVALFLCDTPIPSVVAEDGDYTDVFNALLEKSLPEISAVTFTLDSYDVRNKQEYPPNIDDYHGIILTGSAASAYENLDWINKLVSFVASVAQEKPQVKLIGICFGHQIIARALGGECVPNSGNWEVGVTEVSLSDIGKQLFGVPTLNIQQMHRDHVPELPPSCLLLGSTAVAPNQGMVRFYAGAPTRPSAVDVQIFTVQGHPEFTQRISEKIINTRSSTGVLSAEIVKDAQKRAEWRNDGVSVVGKFIWAVLGVRDARSQI
ncbi:class I glutamine amidotransferase-like protein [Sparassis latifolia]